MSKYTKTKEVKEVKRPKRNVGFIACEALRAGKTNEEALEAVKAEWPDKNTSLASIRWYRNKLRADGDKTVKTARELKKTARELKKKAIFQVKVAAQSEAAQQRDAGWDGIEDKALKIVGDCLTWQQDPEFALKAATTANRANRRDGDAKMLIRVEHSCLLVIDIQEKLLGAMHDGDVVTRNVGILLQAAGRLEVPVLVSEQYPQGLGPTVEAVAGHLPEASGAPSSKLTFSCAADQDYMDRLLPLKRKHAVIMGIEAHVCVLQTALELTDEGYHCFVVADAVASRSAHNHVLALERMNANGCEIVTTEMVLFEWLRRAGGDAFREISKLVR